MCKILTLSREKNASFSNNKKEKCEHSHSNHCRFIEPRILRNVIIIFCNGGKDHGLMGLSKDIGIPG